MLTYGVAFLESLERSRRKRHQRQHKLMLLLGPHAEVYVHQLIRLRRISAEYLYIILGEEAITETGHQHSQDLPSRSNEGLARLNVETLLVGLSHAEGLAGQRADLVDCLEKA